MPSSMALTTMPKRNSSPISENHPKSEDAIALLERNFDQGALAAQAREGGHTGRITVKYLARRIRLLEPENCCTKAFTDGLRYAGLLPDDTEKDIEIKVYQEKVKRKADEETLISIEYPPQ